MKKKHSVKARNRELVSSIYAGALNPSEYNDMLLAWDKHFEALEGNDYEDPSKDFDWAEEFVNHFEQAGKLIDQIQPNTSNSVEDMIKQMPYAAFASMLSGDIVCANQHAGVLSKGGLPDSIFDLPLDSGSEHALRSYIKQSKSKQDVDRKASVIIRVFLDRDEEPCIMICEYIQNSVFSGLLVKSINAIWNRDVEKALMAAFDFTQAELDLVGNLYKGLSIKEIAEWKGRSQATLRTQLSSVLNKTGTKSQSALSRMVVSLAHMIVHKSRKSGVPDLQLVKAKDIYQRRRIIELSNGFILEYIETGDFSGKPFYYIQPSTRPTLTKKIARGLAEKGIRLISPVKPGSGRTTKTPLSFSARDWAYSHLELLNELGIDEFSCGGHCAGGIYAVELAGLAGNKCKSVLLVDAGAPIKSAKTIYEMPPGPRRLFLPARFFYKALVTPIKYMSADFNSGLDGQIRAVDYFCEGSPTDQKIIHDPVLWRLLRDNMAYSMENIPQLASDTAKWAKDNTSHYVKAAKHAHIRFFHGGENLMIHPKHIIKYCKEHDNTSSHIVPGRGQLMVYAEQDLFITEIKTLCEAI